MQFTKLEIAVDSTSYEYLPYDRGQNGAFVFRESNGLSTVYAPRLVVHTANNDAASDKMTVQSNTPRVKTCGVDCPVDTQIGTDLVKTEMRFLASTSKAERALAISKHIAVLEELRDVIEDRDVIYS